MDEMEAARRKERLDNLKLIPAAIVFGIFYFGIYWLFVANSVEIYGFKLTGCVKVLWMYAVVIIAGFGVALLAASLSFIVYLALIAKYMGIRGYTVTAIVIPLLLIALGLFLFYLGVDLEADIRTNSVDINYWYYINIGDGVLGYIVSAAGFVAFILLLAMLVGLVSGLLKLPFNAKSDVIMIRNSTNKGSHAD